MKLWRDHIPNSNHIQIWRRRRDGAQELLVSTPQEELHSSEVAPSGSSQSAALERASLSSARQSIAMHMGGAKVVFQPMNCTLLLQQAHLPLALPTSLNHSLHM